MVIMVKMVRCTPASYDPEYTWLKKERVSGPPLRIRDPIVRPAPRQRLPHEGTVRTAMGLFVGMSLALAGGLWALAVVGHPFSIPLFCSLSLTLVGAVFIIRVIIHEGASATREIRIDGRDH